MKYVMNGIAVVLFVALVSACAKHKSNAHLLYEHLQTLSDDQRREELKSLTPSSRIDAYLYGVEKLRPSDYWLAEDLKDANKEDVALIIDRLDHSSSATNTFALVYVLNVIAHADSQKTKITQNIRTIVACGRYFPPLSPCHRLAAFVDETYKH
jgi:hypothetical protein